MSDSLEPELLECNQEDEHRGVDHKEPKFSFQDLFRPQLLTFDQDPPLGLPQQITLTPIFNPTFSMKISAGGFEVTDTLFDRFFGFTIEIQDSHQNLLVLTGARSRREVKAEGYWTSANFPEYKDESTGSWSSQSSARRGHPSEIPLVDLLARCWGER